MKTACKVASVLCALLSSAVAFSIVGRPGVDLKRPEQAANHETHQSAALLRSDGAEVEHNAVPASGSGTVTVVALEHATAALANAINQLELEADACASPLCGPAWRSFTHPFLPDMQDASVDNLARIEREAMAGNEDALDAFLTLAAGLPDYLQRSQALLQYAGARGSVLALTTLAERSVAGYGLAAPSTEAAAFYEYLAWSTGNWTNRDLALGFSSSFTAVDTTACLVGMSAAVEIAKRREIFQRRVPLAPSCEEENAARGRGAGGRL